MVLQTVPPVVACILGHRYARQLISSLLTSAEYRHGRVQFRGALCIHPSVSFTTGGYEQPFDLLESAGIPYGYFENAASDDVRTALREMSPDFVFVCGLRQLIPENTLRIPALKHSANSVFSDRCGFVAFHPSDLPDGSGMSPIQWTVFEDASSITVSMFLLTLEKKDGGPIIEKQRIEGIRGLSATELDSYVGKAVAELTTRVLRDIARHTLTARPQTEALAPRRVRPPMQAIHRWIDGTQTVSHALKIVKAFARPYGGATTIIRNRMARVFEARADDPGALSNQHAYELSCLDGTISLTKVEWID